MTACHGNCNQGRPCTCVESSQPEPVPVLRELAAATLTAAFLLALVWGFREAVFFVLEVFS